MFNISKAKAISFTSQDIYFKETDGMEFVLIGDLSWFPTLVVRVMFCSNSCHFYGANFNFLCIP